MIVLCGCTSSGKQKRHVIGLSQCMLDDAWREAMINDMRIEASNYDDVEIIIKDAQNNNETQIQQIRDLIRQKVDVLIISPINPSRSRQLPRKRTVPESRRSLQIAR
ncbi:substrate-binding domain-containing protein [Parabacteroides distasonis]|nr:substrate-binding domain-containing protein [Parabacteroides distasonis]